MAEALLHIVDIPIDIGAAHQRQFEPDRVAAAIRKLDSFSLDEIQTAIDSYWNRELSDDMSDKMVKLHLINAYLFRIPEETVADGELLSGNPTFFYGVQRENGNLNLSFPWVFNQEGESRVAASSMHSSQDSGASYRGATLFRIYRRRYPRRFRQLE